MSHVLCFVVVSVVPVFFLFGDFVFSVTCDLVVSVYCELFIFVSGDPVYSVCNDLVFSVYCVFSFLFFCRLCVLLFF